MSPSKKLKEFPSGISSRVFPFASTAIKNPVSSSPLMITDVHRLVGMHPQRVVVVQIRFESLATEARETAVPNANETTEQFATALSDRGKTYRERWTMRPVRSFTCCSMHVVGFRLLTLMPMPEVISKLPLQYTD